MTNVPDPPQDPAAWQPSLSEQDITPTERSISPVAGRLGAGQLGRLVGLAALVVGSGAVYAATWKSEKPRAERLSDEPARQIVPYEPAPGAAPTLTNPGASPPSLDSNHQEVATALDGAGLSSASAPATGQDPPGADREALAAGNARAQASQVHAIRTAPILAYSQGRVQASGSPDEPASPVRAVTAAGPTDLDELRRGSNLGRALARSIGDRNFLILAGTSIPCVLQTALDSGTPGYVTCIIPTDVYSDNGAVILLEKGSKVLGEYRAAMRQGQKRLFVLWTRAVTPGGVSIALASPAADALGRAGFGGALDNHFWERFGGALLLSIVDQGAFAATGADSAGQTTRLPSDAAAIAVQNSINIPPSLRKVQGAEVSIFAAQDFDFSSVYALRSR